MLACSDCVDTTLSSGGRFHVSVPSRRALVRRHRFVTSVCVTFVLTWTPWFAVVSLLRAGRPEFVTPVVLTGGFGRSSLLSSSRRQGVTSARGSRTTPVLRVAASRSPPRRSSATTRAPQSGPLDEPSTDGRRVGRLDGPSSGRSPFERPSEQEGEHRHREWHEDPHPSCQEVVVRDEDVPRRAHDVVAEPELEQHRHRGPPESDGDEFADRVVGEPAEVQVRDDGEGGEQRVLVTCATESPTLGASTTSRNPALRIATTTSPTQSPAAASSRAGRTGRWRAAVVPVGLSRECVVSPMVFTSYTTVRSDKTVVPDSHSRRTDVGVRPESTGRHTAWVDGRGGDRTPRPEPPGEHDTDGPDPTRRSLSFSRRTSLGRVRGLLASGGGSALDTCGTGCVAVLETRVACEIQRMHLS